MKTLRNGLMALLIASTFALISACGGGGSGDGGGSSAAEGGGASPPGQNDGSGTEERTFTVSLASAEVRRSSSGDALVIDASGITSGTLILRQ